MTTEPPAAGAGDPGAAQQGRRCLAGGRRPGTRAATRRRRGRAAWWLLAAIPWACSSSLPEAPAARGEPEAAAGAHGGDASDTQAAFTPLSAAASVGKVKTLLVGTGATAEEAAAFEADPSALAAMVRQWLDDPAAKTQLRAFYRVALQQSQATGEDFELSLRISKNAARLIASLQESMVRTTEAIVAAGRPFTETATTKQFIMTTAQMSALSFLDQMVVTDANTVEFPWGGAPPFSLLFRADADGGPIPLAESIDPAHANYMTFASPTPFSCTLPTLDATGHVVVNERGRVSTTSLPYNQSLVKAGRDDFLFAYLFAGFVDRTNTHVKRPEETIVVPKDVPAAMKAQYRTSCANREYKAATLVPTGDYEDWRPVSIRPVGAAETPTRFWNLPALRAQNDLALKTSRVGFFGQLAFLANCPSNASNDHRVVANQALIVAVGRSINPVDSSSIPVLDTGEDGQHSDPTSPCFACHRVLDPMRNVFRRNLTECYRLQTDARAQALTGLFDYLGVQRQVASLDDFAQALVDHPLYPQAQVQKLCYWANSAPCAEDDPEFLGLAKQFADRGYNFKELLVATLSSPLVTGRSATQTWAARGDVVSVMRYDTACAALSARMGLAANLCAGQAPDTVDRATAAAAAAQISLAAANMQSLRFARGAQAPVVSTAATMFYQGAAEALCATAASFAVDQPGSKFQSRDKDQALDALVAQVMGVVGDEALARQAREILANHFERATAQGATATDALRSSVVLACSAPSSLSIGL